jgi:type IV secretory pathway VirB2 component (pilin)
MHSDLPPLPTPSLLSAAEWLQGSILGSLVTAVAAISIAALGFLLLQGRIEIRPSATAVIGCFLLFGAPIIAMKIRAGAAGVTNPEQVVPVAQQSVPLPPVTQNTRPPGYDPYAGASLVR